MKIHVISDIHMEQGIPWKKMTTQADIAILAGDIGNPYKDNYRSLLVELSLTHKVVFVVSGNHEYYNTHTMEEVEKRIRNVCEDLTNVHYLQKDVYVWNKIKFIGCTLWADAKDPSLCKQMGDFTHVPEMTFEKFTALNADHRSWLEGELGKNSKDYDRTCVITHHVPTLELISPMYRDHPLNEFFVGNVTLENDGVDTWCYGHTHTSNHQVLRDTQYICNPGGYSWEYSRWDKNKVFSFQEYDWQSL